MAATLEDLSRIEAVAIAFEFTPDGKIKQYKNSGSASDEMASSIA